MQPSLVPTPRGWWPASCVHHIPSTSRIMAPQQYGISIEHADGTSTHLLPCSHPDGSLHKLRRATLYDRAYPVVFEGNIHSSISVQQFSAVYPVPSVPANVGQTLHWWIGAEDPEHQVVIQPVLTWMPDYGSRWVHAAWNCCPHGHQFHGDMQWAEVGEKISGSIRHSRDAFLSTTYQVSTVGVNGMSTLSFDDSLNFSKPQLALETNLLQRTCNMMPDSDMTMEDIKITPLTEWHDAWWKGMQWRIEECGWKVKLSQNKLVISPPEPPSPPSPSPSPAPPSAPPSPYLPSPTPPSMPPSSSPSMPPSSPPSMPPSSPLTSLPFKMVALISAAVAFSILGCLAVCYLKLKCRRSTRSRAGDRAAPLLTSDTNSHVRTDIPSSLLEPARLSLCVEDDSVIAAQAMVHVQGQRQVQVSGSPERDLVAESHDSRENVGGEDDLVRSHPLELHSL